MAVYLIDKIKPKNNGTFGMADTVDIDHSDGRRLDVVLDEIAEKADGGGTAVTRSRSGSKQQKVRSLQLKMH